MANDLISVRFVKRFNAYNPGEIAGFSQETVKKLLKDGVAVLNRPDVDADITSVQTITDAAGNVATVYGIGEAGENTPGNAEKSVSGDLNAYGKESEDDEEPSGELAEALLGVEAALKAENAEKSDAEKDILAELENIVPEPIKEAEPTKKEMEILKEHDPFEAPAKEKGKGGRPKKNG